MLRYREVAAGRATDNRHRLVACPTLAVVARRWSLADAFARTMICDYLRIVGMNADDPNQIEDVMARELKKTLAEEMHGAHALQSMADALPALGIVAAVLGVIKTMGHIDQPPKVLGAMIGDALTGTFLGALLAYGLAAPQVSVESGRKMVPNEYMPSFQELEEAVQSVQI